MGIKFKYDICAAGDTERRHDVAAGTEKAESGEELLIIRVAGEKQEKKIHRSSFEDALKIVLDHRKKREEITDPEQLNAERAGYIYSMYKRFGVV